MPKMTSSHVNVTNNSTAYPNFIVKSRGECHLSTTYCHSGVIPSMVLFQGLKYLHDGAIKCHGKLKSSNCVIDSRWACKLTDYGLFQLRADQETDPEISDFKRFSRMSYCLFDAR